MQYTLIHLATQTEIDAASTRTELDARRHMLADENAGSDPSDWRVVPTTVWRSAKRAGTRIV
jgi:hypothetical protein